jgi:ribosomal protein S18 acetylase RimI-like enzyme
MTYQIRPATEADLDRIAEFEIDIARISFAEDAIVDPALHRKRVGNALGKPGETTLVAVSTMDPSRPLGWAWLTGRSNSLTGARYGNFRSLAVAEHRDRAEIGELLLEAVLIEAQVAGLTELVGKVHAGNIGMRALYRKFGFEAMHLTMRLRTDGG